MKFTTSEMPTDPEESGTSVIIETKEKLAKMARNEPVLTDRNGEVEEPEVNDNMNGTTMPDVNSCSARQPVENGVSDSEDNSSGEKEEEENEDLSDTMSKCCISENSTAKDEDEELTQKISNLSVEDKQQVEPVSRDDDQYIEIKSSDIKTEEELEICRRQHDETVSERGPTGGVATNYHPQVPQYNHIAAKRYPANVNYQYYDQGQRNYAYNPNQQIVFNNAVCQQRQPVNHYQQPQQNIKRTRDDFEDPPIKFTRPVAVENNLNNLSDPPKMQNPNLTDLNVVSKKNFSGGQVTVKSPDIDTEPLIPGFGTATTSGEFDFLSMLTKDDTFLDSAGVNTNPVCPNTSQYRGNQHCQNNIPQTSAHLHNQDTYLDHRFLNMTAVELSIRNGNEKRTSFSDTDVGSEGYVSDVASPYSDQQDSPPTVEQSMYSPPPSVDSGACVSSPGSQVDMCSPRSTLTGYESNLDTYDPNSSFGPVSPENGNQTIKQNIPAMTQNIPVMNQNIPAVSQTTQPIQNRVPPQGYQTNVGMTRMDYPVSMQNKVAPVNPAYPSGYTQNGNVHDAATTEDQLIMSDYINQNLEQLKDVMETIADDMMDAQKRQKPKNTHNSSQPLPKQVLPQQRPPPVPQPLQTKPVASVLPSQTPNIIPSVPTTSAPVLLVQQPQKTMAVPVSTQSITTSQSMGVPQAAVTTNQILVIPAAPQPAPTFVIVTPQQMNPVRRQTQYRPIQPKIQPNPAPGKGSSTDSKPAASLPKTSSSPRPVQQVPPVPSMTPVQQTQCPKVQNQAPKNSANQLNIARRLVANMTSDDLKSMDKDKDTYLHVAVCRADKYMVQALLERIVRENLQSMIDTQNSERQTPVYLAVSANQPEMVDLFNKYGADVNLLAERIAPNGQKEVKAAIHSAVSNGKEYLQTLKALLKSPDLNLNLFNSDGLTALHCALVEHGQPRYDPQSPNGKAVPIDSKPIIEALIRAGADPNAQDKTSGKTAFMYALASSDCTLIETLLCLVDGTKLRSYFRTQAFDGSTCVKILESRKTDFPQVLYEKLTGIVSTSRTTFNQRRVIDVV